MRRSRAWFGWVLGVLIALTPAGEVSSQGTVGQYLIRLRGLPAAAQLAARGASGAEKLSLASQEAASYRDLLRTRQEGVKHRIEALPQAQVAAQMDTVFNGLAVSLRTEDVDVVLRDPDVEEVIPALLYHKLLDAALPLMQVPEGWSHPGIGGEDNAGAGVRIAVIDSGIDISHPMLQDPSIIPPPGFPRFTDATPDCPSSDERFTNSKVIVARNYVRLLGTADPNCDAADRDGHGTSMASVAAGRRTQAPQASLVGVAPKAFLGSYKVFGTPGINDATSSSAILKALDDAVKDGMHIINISLGTVTTWRPITDPLSLAVTAAVEAGVTVVVAAGNGGPVSSTINSPGIAPAAITVGSSSSSRSFVNLLRITAAAPPPSGLETIRVVSGNGPGIQTLNQPVPLATVALVDPTELACSPLPPASLRGQAVLIQAGCCRFSTKIQNAVDAGALAALVYNNQQGAAAFAMEVGDAKQIPSAMIGNRDGISLQQFLATAPGNVRVSVGAEWTRVAATPDRTSPFSSYGPSTDFEIKPDLVATGANLLSATQRSDPAGEQYDPSGYGFSSGTSVSAALVSGAAALVRQRAPGFGPAQIKSALVNSAVRVTSASVLAQGNGLLDLNAALHTPAVVAPVSISFGTHAPGSLLRAAAHLQITNVGLDPDTFTVSAVSTAGSQELTITASPSRFVLGGGGTASIAVDAESSAPIAGTVEGYLSIREENSRKMITVPYWGNFLQPSVSAGGIVNAASFSFGPTSLAPGSLISIFGTDLRSAGEPTVQISFFGVPVLFSSSGQINTQVPFELAGRSSAQVVVQVNGVFSPAVTIPITPAAPGIFYPQGRIGQGFGAILHNRDLSPVTPENPARPGEVLSVFAAGLGAVYPPGETGIAASTFPLAASTVTHMPSATIAGLSARIEFSGLAPCFVGVYQVNVEVPVGTPTGDQTLTLTSRGLTSNAVKLPVGALNARARNRRADSKLPQQAGLCGFLADLISPRSTG